MKAIIIDGNSLLFRAYYATAHGDTPLMRTKSGIPTNAIYAFSNMLAHILQSVELGDIFFVAFDADSHTFRKEEYEGYKATRKPCPTDLIPQFPISRELLDALGVPHYEEHGVEADDIAGSLAKKLSQKEIPVLLYTSDRDYLQLIDKNIHVALPKKGLSELQEINEETLKEMMGLSPLQIIDYKGLRGDDSDNLPGIKGIGEKTAIKLLQEYGCFEEIMKHKDEIPGKLGEKIRLGEKDGYLSYRLAKIKIDCPLPFQLENLTYHGFSLAKVASFSSKYEFRALSTRLPKKLINTKESDELPMPFIVSSWDELKRERPLTITFSSKEDCYHQQFPEYVTLSDGMRTFTIPFQEVPLHEDLSSYLKNPFEKKITYDAKALCYQFMKKGISIEGIVDDVKVSSYLLDPGSAITQEKFLAKLGYTKPDNEKDFSSLFAFLIAKENEKNLALLKGMGSLKLYRDIEFPLVFVLEEMEKEGIPLHQEVLESYKKEFQSKKEKAMNDVLQYASTPFNLNSPAQVAHFLYEELHLPSTRGKSTSGEALIALYEEHPVIQSLLEYRKYQKLLSTYIDGLLPHIEDDYKIHTYFNNCETATGRLSSSSPNLQNIGAKEEEGRKVRKAFYYPDEDIVLLSLDYGQIELRILAEMANSKNYQKVFEEGRDVHTETARRIFHKENISHEERQKAKAINFAIIYGSTIHGLAEQIGTSFNEAKEIISSFYEAYPEIKTFLDSLVNMAEEKGYVETILGRRRYIREIHDPSFPRKEAARRAAMNAPIQGSAADLIKAAMIKVHEFLSTRDTSCRLILQIHDELIFAIRKEEIEEIAPKLEEIMEHALPLKVKLKVERGVGHTWYDCKE